MKTKTKLAGIVIAFMLALSAMVVGIWAVSTATVNLGGNISFTANDVYAKITGSITGAKEGNIELPELEYSATEEPKGDLSSWQQNRSLNFADKTTDIKITITIENLSSERSLDVIIKDTIGAQTNLNKSVSFKNGNETEVTENVLGTKYTISAGTGNSATYTIKLSIANKNNSVQANYGYNLVLNDENYVAPPEIKVISNDTTLGSVTGGVEGVNDGDEITLTATQTSGSTFMGWAVEKNEVQATEEMTISAQSTETLPIISNMQVVSTDSTYTFTYSKDKPTTYYALFNGTTGEVTKDNIKYTLYNEAKLACVTDESSATGPITIPETIKNAEIDYLVYMIGNSAFESNSNITSVEIPNSIINIGSYAFSDCSNLKSVIIPDSVISIGQRAFQNCSNLDSVIIGNGVTSIGISAFSWCSSLELLTIGSSVKSIGESAFEGCSMLNKIEIPDGVTRIDDSAFSRCTGLTSVTIPESVTSIGSAFKGCNTSIFTEENNAYYLGNSSNEYLVLVKAKDTSIESCEINNNTKLICSQAFYGCSGLTGELIIPNSVTSIGSSAFHSCSGLTSVTIPNSVTSIGDYAFNGCNTSIFTEYNNGYYLGNSSNSYLVFVKAIKTSIESCEINNNTKLICSSAFENCRSLTSIEIPDSVTSIGDYAFYNCSGLTSITINRATPPELGSDAIPSNVTAIKVPSESVELYKSASGWSSFENKIQAIG